MADSSRELHEAIVAALRADTDITAEVSTRVYDAAPQHTAFPFIVVSLSIGEPFDAQALDGWEAIMRVDIFSRKGGQAGQAYDIAKACHAALHNQTLTLSTQTFVNGRMLPGGQRMVRDDDMETVHILQRYRYVTHA